MPVVPLTIKKKKEDAATLKDYAWTEYAKELFDDDDRSELPPRPL